MGARIWAVVIDPTTARILPDLDRFDGEEPTEFIRHATAAYPRKILAEEAEGISPDGPHDVAEDSAAIVRDAVRRDMADFVQEVLRFLEIRRRADRFDRLAVFADPSILPLVRTGLSAPMHAGSILRPARHLLALPETTLRRRLAELIDHEPTQSGDMPQNQGSA